MSNPINSNIGSHVNSDTTGATALIMRAMTDPNNNIGNQLYKLYGDGLDVYRSVQGTLAGLEAKALYDQGKSFSEVLPLMQSKYSAGALAKAKLDDVYSGTLKDITERDTNTRAWNSDARSEREQTNKDSQEARAADRYQRIDLPKAYREAQTWRREEQEAVDTAAAQAAQAAVAREIAINGEASKASVIDREMAKLSTPGAKAKFINGLNLAAGQFDTVAVPEVAAINPEKWKIDEKGQAVRDGHWDATTQEGEDAILAGATRQYDTWGSGQFTTSKDENGKTSYKEINYEDWAADVAKKDGHVIGDLKSPNLRDKLVELEGRFRADPRLQQLGISKGLLSQAVVRAITLRGNAGLLTNGVVDDENYERVVQDVIKEAISATERDKLGERLYVFDKSNKNRLSTPYQYKLLRNQEIAKEEERYKQGKISKDTFERIKAQIKAKYSVPIMQATTAMNLLVGASNINSKNVAMSLREQGVATKKKVAKQANAEKAQDALIKLYISQAID